MYIMNKNTYIYDKQQIKTSCFMLSIYFNLEMDLDTSINLEMDLPSVDTNVPKFGYCKILVFLSKKISNYK